MDPTQAQQIVNDSQKVTTAAIELAKTSAPFDIYPVTYALDAAVDRNAAQPVSIPFPFRQAYVRDATDSGTYVYLVPSTGDSIQGESKLTKKDSFESDLPVVNSRLYWPAQPGKTITIEFHVASRFTPGNASIDVTTSVPNGGSTLAAGSVGTAAAALLAADTTRTQVTIQNQGTSSIYVGPDNAVTVPGGTNPGIEVPPGGYFYWKNTGALYAIAVTANAAIAMIKE